MADDLPEDMPEDPTGLRYYGSDMTIHRDDALDVEVDEHGAVVAVWFRCQPLPFKQSTAGRQRAAEMKRMYEDGRHGTSPAIEAVVLREGGRS